MGLVGYEDIEQEVILRQIESFIVRVARRSIVDMVRLGNRKELATMWYKKNDEKLSRIHCDHVLQGKFTVVLDFVFCV